MEEAGQNKTVEQKQKGSLSTKRKYESCQRINNVNGEFYGQRRTGEKRNSGVEDATIVATHLLLAAYNEGIDSCWINFFDPQKVAQELNLPENEEVVMMLDLGYGKQKEPLPNHHLRKELDETVKYL